MHCPVLQRSRRRPTVPHALNLRTRLPALTLCLLALLGPTPALRARTAETVTRARRAQTQARPDFIEREMGDSDLHSYRLQLAPGRILRVVAEQRGIDVAIVLAGSDGRELLRADSPSVGSWGPEALFHEVETAGSYFMQVLPRKAPAPRGRYELRIETRPVTVRDRNERPPEIVFAEASRELRASPGSHQSALVKFEDALRRFRAARDWRGELVALTTIASVRASVGDEQSALPFFEEALGLQLTGGDERGAAVSRTAIARAYHSLGDTDRALEQLAAARQGFASVGDRRLTAYTHVRAGALHDAAGDRRAALADYESALALFREAGDRQGEASTLNDLGLVHGALGDEKRSREFYEQALALMRQTGQCFELAPALSNVAFGALEAGDKEKALAYLNEALAIQRGAGDRDGQARTHNNLGFVYNSLGQREVALEHLGQALAINRATGNREGEGDAFGNLMFAWRAGRRPQLAIFYGKQAVNAYQEIRGRKASLDKESQRNFIRSRAHTYEQLAGLLISRDRLLEAQQVLGLLKEEEYFDYLRRDSREGAGLDGRAAMNAAESDFERRYSAIAESLPQLARLRSELEARKPNLTADESRQLDKINADLSVAEEVFRKFVSQMTNEMPESARDDAASLDADAQGIVADLQRLGPGVAAVYTSIGEEKYRVIVFTKDLKVGREYPIKSAELYKKIFAFRQALEDPRGDPRPLAQELYRILVGPVASTLKGAQVETLMWSLTGPLRYIPVAALHDGEKYLVERYRNTVFTPVNTSHLTDESGAVWRGLGLGVSKSQKQFSALPEVPQELNSIFRDTEATPDASGVIAGKVFLDEMFTEETFFTQLRQRHPVIHIASHFHFQPGNVANSFLLLGNGAELSLARIRGTPNIFAGVDLLALSACETASAGVDADGKEVEGFAVLAQQKGARSVLASLWPVADKSTPLLMERFYQARHRRPGTFKAEALREAQIALAREHPEFAHPFYWAPFILIGNWR